MSDDYRTYQDVLAVGIRILQPDTEVETADLDTLEEVIERFKPHVLISDQPEPMNPRGWAIWVEISVDPTKPTKVSACGHRTERTNPTLQELLGVLDEIRQRYWPNQAAP